MTNIWTQVFEDIRKPYFEMEDPYTLSEKMAKKDWDGDGEIESEKDEVWGSRARAAAAAGKPFTKKKKVEEGVEGSAADEKADKKGMKRTGMTEKEWEASEEDKEADAKLAKKMKKEEYVDEASIEKVKNFTDRQKVLRRQSRDYGGVLHPDDWSSQGEPVRQLTHAQKRGVKTKVKEEYVDEAQVANRDPDKYEGGQDRKSTRLNSSHVSESRMPSSA